jgi:hypothetical protein
LSLLRGDRFAERQADVLGRVRWSLSWITPSPGLQRASVISGASTTRLAFMWVAIDQPTI